MPQPETAACHKNVMEPSFQCNRNGGLGRSGREFRKKSVPPARLLDQAGGNSPKRLAMILSTIRFGSTAVIRCRIGSGVSS
jgi:hypothetical protein